MLQNHCTSSWIQIVGKLAKSCYKSLAWQIKACQVKIICGIGLVSVYAFVKHCFPLNQKKPSNGCAPNPISVLTFTNCHRVGKPFLLSDTQLCTHKKQSTTALFPRKTNVELSSCVNFTIPSTDGSAYWFTYLLSNWGKLDMTGPYPGELS